MKRPLLPLAVATFAAGADGFVIAGLLPQIAQQLGVSLATAGQLITAFSVTLAVSAPVLGALTGEWNRRQTLQLALLLLVVGNVLTALAPSYYLALAARILTALGASLIVPTATSAAAALVPPNQHGQAFGTVMGGFTLASLVAIPIGSALGQHNWRLTLWAVSVLAALALLGVSLVVPKLQLPVASLRERLTQLKNPRVPLTLSVTVLGFAATYTVFTYISAVLGEVTLGSTVKFSALVFLGGLGYFLGTTLGGRWTDQVPPRRILTWAFTGMTLFLIILPFVLKNLWLTVIWEFATFGFFGGLTVVPQQKRLASLSPSAMPLLLGLNSSGLNLGIALGGAIGGFALHWLKPSYLGWVAAGLAALGLLMSTVTKPESGMEGK